MTNLLCALGRGRSSTKIKRRVYERFECAVIINNVKELRAILSEYPTFDLNFRLRRHGDSNGFLHTAVRHKASDALQFLLEQCASKGLPQLVDQVNASFETPLHLAIHSVQPALVDLLLTAQAANCVQCMPDRQTPLLMALRLYVKYRDICTQSSRSSSDANSSLHFSPTSAFAQRAAREAWNREQLLAAEYEANKRRLAAMSAVPWPVEGPLVRRRDNELKLRLMRKILISLMGESDPSSWLLTDINGENVFQIALAHQVDFVLSARPFSTKNCNADLNGNYFHLLDNESNQENRNFFNSSLQPSAPSLQALQQPHLPISGFLSSDW